MSKETETDNNMTQTESNAYISRATVLARFPIPMNALKLSSLVKRQGFPEPIVMSRGDVWYPADAVRAWLAAKFAPLPLVTRSTGGRRGKKL